MEERLWVIAFDNATGKMAEFTSCPKNNAAFYRETYLLKGYMPTMRVTHTTPNVRFTSRG